jgi:hypothetical protein
MAYEEHDLQTLNAVAAQLFPSFNQLQQELLVIILDQSKTAVEGE